MRLVSMPHKLFVTLRHRLRKDPLAQIDDGERVRDIFKKVFGME